MSRIFAHAKFFDSDVSKWDVSKVKDMSGMFLGATSFNGDLSKWDVSNVKDMYGMFWGATLFTRKLCGGTWLESMAKKTMMFEGSFGSIPRTACTRKFPIPTMPAVTEPVILTQPVVVTRPIKHFAPTSKSELKYAVDAYVRLASQDKGFYAPYGPMGGWDVSRVTDMSNMFANAKLFNGDISNWDVSNVRDMFGLFFGATSFNRDLSKKTREKENEKWDVSNVKNCLLYTSPSPRD